MEERLSIPRKEGIDRNALRLWAMIIAALGALGRGVLQTRLLGVGTNTSAELMELLEISGGMAAAAAAIALQAIESSAVPIFAVLLTEGFEKTKNVKNYILRVAAVAAASEIPYNFAMSAKLVDSSSRNPVCGVLLALIMLYLFSQFAGEGAKGTFVKAAVTVAAMLWAAIFRVEYGMSMVFIVCILWLFRERPTLRLFLGAAAALCCTIGQPLFLFAPMGFLLVHFYNGEEGQSNRLLQYALYPIVLLLVGVVGTFAFA